MFMEFRSKQELSLMPQTMEEHRQDQEDSSDDDSNCDADEEWYKFRRKSLHTGNNHSRSVRIC